MSQLVLGGVTVNLQEFSVLPDEQGGGDWRRRNWSAKVVLGGPNGGPDADAAAATLRTALQYTTPRAYRRMINGALRGGPLITCSGDRLGGTVSCGVEIGEQAMEITAPVRLIFHHVLPLTLREE